MAIQRSRSKLGKSILAVLAAVSLLGVAGFAAYKYLFSRPGEAAVSLIPSDVDMVITIDTNPSQRQLATFTRIGQALKEEGLLDKLDKTLDEMLDGAPVAAEIRPHVSHSYAMAFWMPEGDMGQEPEVVVLMATSNAGAVQQSLAKHGKKADSFGVEAYQFADGNASAAVIDDYLAIAPKPEHFARIKAVKDGSSQSLASQAEYRAARSSLAEDSNFMLFMSPKIIQKLDKMSDGALGMYSSAKWLSFGLAVGDKGLEMSYRCPYDSDRMPILKTLAGIKPVSEDVLKKLPDGAYGVMAYSEAGKYWQFFKDAMVSEQEAAKAFEEGIAEFEKETGLSVEKDVVPAFNGNLVAAVYPATDNPTKSVDIVLMFDDANGANPAALAAKLRALAEQKSAEEGEGVHFVMNERDGAKVYLLDPKSEKSFQEAMSEGLAATSPAPDVSGSGQFDYEAFKREQLKEIDNDPSLTPEQKKELKKAMGLEGSVAPMPQPTPENEFLQGKTFAHAEVGNALVIASSQGILNRTLDAMRGGGKSLAADPSFIGMAQDMDKRAQSYLLVDIHRILTTIKPLIEEGMKDAPFTADDIIGIFGEAGRGLVATGRYDGDVAEGEFFLPLDYVKVIKLIGAGAREFDKSMNEISMKAKGTGGELDGSPTFAEPDPGLVGAGTGP
ncbi:MAG TPA: DUF3352 domain-containing protein [Fimbriimonadaceae bacterium]|nr:DUF3352 domain-containing protein [Fimbriimonadaceae bacterium]